MASRTMEQTVLDLERNYWQALKDKDVDAVLHMTADPCLIVGAQGVRRMDRTAFAQNMSNPNWDIVDFEIGDNPSVEVLGRNTAILVYDLHEDLRIDGETMSIDAADSSTWVRRDGRWMCALHTESLLGDPFGRDRRGANG